MVEVLAHYESVSRGKLAANCDGTMKNRGINAERQVFWTPGRTKAIRRSSNLQSLPAVGSQQPINMRRVSIAETAHGARGPLQTIQSVIGGHCNEYGRSMSP
jgi:hypothetical protein